VGHQADSPSTQMIGVVKPVLPSVAAETVRRMACDASIITVLENEEGEPLNVGRKTRSIPPALRRALNARDRGCRFPGCSNTQYVDAHHIQSVDSSEEPLVVRRAQ
jgi:hypothetical protein